MKYRNKKKKRPFKDNIPGWPGYYVTKTGRVWSRHVQGAKGNVEHLESLWHLASVSIKYAKDKTKNPTEKYQKFNMRGELLGRPKVMLTRYNPDGSSERRQFTVHRLVAIAWIPNPDNKPCIGHKDNNTRNNKVSNLYWCTHQENIAKAALEGRMSGYKPRGTLENHSQSKLTNSQRIEIIRLHLEEGLSIKEIFKLGIFPVKPNAIRHTIKNQECLKLYYNKYGKR